MLPPETKQSGGKILPHSDLQGEVFLEEASHNRKRMRDISLGTWNVRSLYRAGSLRAAARELGRYKLDVVYVQEVRCGTKGAQYKLGTITFSMGKGMKIISLEHDFLYTKGLHQRLR
jgi:hypothetical protein